MNIPTFQRQLLKWFKQNKRDKYPWRHTQNSYHILMAETFLQRTKANQVLPVYEKFIKTFPTIAELVQADDNHIKTIVYPIGLAWRAKNLKQTALDIQHKFNGSIPSNKKQLLEIKGVGDYIADCIRYLAFEIRTSIIDANVVRILGRIHGIETHAESRRNKKFRELADELLPKRVFRNFNLALLDLGALICIRNPRCQSCPVNSQCNYFTNEFV